MFKLLRAFSAAQNVRNLSDYTCPQDQLSFTYGIAFCVLCWTTMSNTFMYVNYDLISNFLRAFEIVQIIIYEIALNRVVALQCLFFIGGLITAYRWLASPEKNLSIWRFLLKRYLRYTPAYALVIALILVTPTWGSGPTWKAVLDPIYANCKNNWWYNLLYINNYMDSNKVCLEHTWVFAVDAQLHILAVFILIPLKMRPKIGLMVNFVLLVAALASIALTNVYYDLPPNEVLSFVDTKDRRFYAEHSYFRLYTNIPLYCTGVFVAYFMTHYPKIKIAVKYRCMLWFLCAAGILAAACTVHEWKTGQLPSPMIAAIYAALGKVAQCAFLAWVAVACMSGNASGLRDILSWRPFHFLSRLFFISYIMHVPIMLMVQGFAKTHMFINDMQLFYIVLNHVAATAVVAYLLYMFFEAPCIALMGLVCRRHKGQNLDSTSDIRPMTEKPREELPSWKACDKSNC